MNLLRQLRQHEDGQDLLEYGLLASLIAVAAVAAVTMLGDHIYTFFWSTIGTSI